MRCDAMRHRGRPGSRHFRDQRRQPKLRLAPAGGSFDPAPTEVEPSPPRFRYWLQ